MPAPTSIEEYAGSPDDIVFARRVAGTGAVFVEPSELIPGMPECDCHRPDAERPGQNLPVIHEGDVVKMRRAEVVGYFRDTPDGPVWNEGRSDFELVEEPRKAARRAKADAQPEQPADAATPETAEAASA